MRGSNQGGGRRRDAFARKRGYLRAPHVAGSASGHALDSHYLSPFLKAACSSIASRCILVADKQLCSPTFYVISSPPALTGHLATPDSELTYVSDSSRLLIFLLDFAVQ